MSADTKNDPHAGTTVFESGASPARARAGMIMLHGRGAEAKSFIRLSDDLAQPDVRYLAPQAEGRTWYPYPFTEPSARNQPFLDGAVSKVLQLIGQLETEGIPKSRIVLLGFSQGACLALHTAANYPVRYGGVVSLSGGLIGDNPAQLDYNGDLMKTPVFLGLGKNDPYVTPTRLQESVAIMKRLNADVTDRIDSGPGHSIREGEVRFVRGLLASILHDQNEKPL